ncbi:MAG: hypothetical protein ACFFAN_11175, partial [Promethearchaeota archaeon]
MRKVYDMIQVAGWFSTASIFTFFIYIGVLPLICFIIVISFSLCGAIILGMFVKYYRESNSYTESPEEYGLENSELYNQQVLANDYPNMYTIVDNSENYNQGLIFNHIEHINVPEGKIRCPDCKEIIEEGLTFCPECG